MKKVIVCMLALMSATVLYAQEAKDASGKKKKTENKAKKKEERKKEKEKRATVKDQDEKKSLGIATTRNIVSDTSLEPYTINFFGDANIQKSLSNGTDIPANTGVGISLMRNFKQEEGKFKLLKHFELEMTINIASTVDTLKTQHDNNGNVTNVAQFGNSVLLPLNSGQAFSASAKAYFSNYKFRKRGYNLVKDDKEVKTYGALLGFLSGFYINITGSNRNWKDNDVVIKATTMSVQGGFFYEFVPLRYSSTPQDFSITLGAGFTGRFLLSDLGQNENDTLRSKFLSVNKDKKVTSTFFPGLEAIVAFKIKNIKAGVRIPVLNRGADANIPGLTGVQPNTYIVFTGGFPIKL